MRFGIIMGAILVVTVCFSPTLAMSTRVYSLSEGNLSIDLGPGFEIGQKKVDNSNNGSFDQNVQITNSQTKGVAILQIIDLYDETLRSLDPAAISELWLQGAMSSALKDGGKPVGNWSVIDNNGKYTTVHTVGLVNTSMSYMSETVEFANWNIDKNTHVGIMSSSKRNIIRNASPPKPSPAVLYNSPHQTPRLSLPDQLPIFFACLTT
jgi:hypothetical protein